MKKLLALAAAGETVFGLVLLAYPPIVVRLLFGAEITGAGAVLSRMAGIALIALGLACWQGSTTAQALWGMLTYSLLVTLYLAYLGHPRRVGREPVVAGDGHPRHIDDSSGSRMAQQSAHAGGRHEWLYKGNKWQLNKQV